MQTRAYTILKFVYLRESNLRCFDLLCFHSQGEFSALMMFILIKFRELFDTLLKIRGLT